MRELTAKGKTAGSRFVKQKGEKFLVKLFFKKLVGSRGNAHRCCP